MALLRLPRRLEPGEEATLVDHLGELRARLLISLGAIVPAFVVAFVFRDIVIEWLMDPLPAGRRLVTLGVAEPFTTSVKVSLIVALALALPVIVYQIWSFLAPAMTRETQRILSGFVIFATALFVGGVAFGYTLVLPKAVTFLTEFDSHLYEVDIRASYYLTFVAMALFGMGLIFELPIFLLALVRLRILTADRLRKNRRMGYALSVFVAVLLPTVDIVSLALEVLPVIALFELSIWLAVLMERRWERLAVEQELAEDL